MSQKKKLIDSAQLCQDFTKQLVRSTGVTLKDGHLICIEPIEEFRQLAGIADAQWTLLLAELSEFDLVSAIADAEEVVLTQDAEEEAIRAMEDEDPPSADDGDTETEDQPATSETTKVAEAPMKTVAVGAPGIDPAAEGGGSSLTIPSAPPGPDQGPTGWETVTPELQDAGQSPVTEGQTLDPQEDSTTPVTVVDDDADIVVTSVPAPEETPAAVEEPREPDTDPPPGGSAPEMIPPHPAEICEIEKPAQTMLDASPEPIPPDESEVTVAATIELPLQTSPFGFEIPVMSDGSEMTPGDATDTVITDGEVATDEIRPCSTHPEALADECEEGDEEATPSDTIVADVASPATESNEGGTSEASTEDNPPPRTPEEIAEALDRR